MTAILSVILCLALVGADQFIKYLVVEYLKPIEYVDVVDGFLRFRYVENTGAVFGSFATHTVLLTIFSVILLAFTIYFLVTNKSKSRLVNFCLLLMISGGVGNIIDRIRLQYVVDYIEPTFVNFAVFNFADCLITVGAFILIIYLVVDLIKDIRNEKNPVNDACDAEENGDDKKNSRFVFKRKVKKAEVEGDKEAVVFNAVIDGESPEIALNDIKMGIESKQEIFDEADVSDLNEADSDEQNVKPALADDNEAFDSTNEIDSESVLTESVADEEDVDNKGIINEPDEAPNTDSKSKKISIDSIDDIDFSLFE